jgi:hypothetical protein
MCVASCVPLLTSKKDNGGEGKKVDGGPALIKPKLRDDPGETGAKSKDDQSQLSDKAKKFEEKPSIAASDKSATLPRQEPRAEKSPPGKEPEIPVSRVTTAKGKEFDSATVLAGKAEDALKELPDVDVSKIDTSFKKHDHAKYTEKITNSAKDLVHKESNCKFARLCQDTTTEQWDLSLYFFREKTYVLAAYAWDAVDEKWKEAFTADRQPISQWKNHLEFSAARRKCSILKGTLP